MLSSEKTGRHTISSIISGKEASCTGYYYYFHMIVLANVSLPNNLAWLYLPAATNTHCWGSTCTAITSQSNCKCVSSSVLKLTKLWRQITPHWPSEVTQGHWLSEIAQGHWPTEVAQGHWPEVTQGHWPSEVAQGHWPTLCPPKNMWLHFL